MATIQIGTLLTRFDFRRKNNGTNGLVGRKEGVVYGTGKKKVGHGNAEKKKGRTFHFRNEGRRTFMPRSKKKGRRMGQKSRGGEKGRTPVQEAKKETSLSFSGKKKGPRACGSRKKKKVRP